MFRRIVLSAVLGLLATTLVFAQRTQPSQPRVTTEVVVRVTYEDDRPVGEQVRVQLSNSSGIPIAETFTRNEGEARFLGVEAGAYRLRVTGLDIEEKTSDYSFVVNPRQITHIEFIRVRRRPDKEGHTSKEGSISAAALNVPPKAESEFDKGVNAMLKQNLIEAHKRFSRALEIYPRYAAALNNLGVIAMQQGRKQEGQDFFRQAVKVDDQHAASYLNLAKSVVANNGHAEATQLLSKATSLDPTNVEIIAILALIEFESREYTSALANARRVHGMPAHEKFAFSHYVAGKVLESQNHREEALTEYRLFLKEAPASPSAENVRGFIAALEQKR